MNYVEFLETKKHTSLDYGIKPIWIPDKMFDFQKYITELTLIKGRWADFMDTGTGKTIIELTIAYNHVLTSNKRVLIITPLAVADQHIREVEKFGIDEVEHSRNGEYNKKIVLINYERLHYVDSADFDCVILDESSILKNFNGAIKNKVTSFMKKIKYRYLFTATPSPNDFIELGTSSEVLGYLGYMDMLGKFFKNNQNDTGGRNNIGEKFYLKPHAEKDFFSWVNQWALTMKLPSDIGFNNEGYELPLLKLNKHVIKNSSLMSEEGQYLLYTPIAKTMTEVRHEQKQTEQQRSEKAVELAHDKTSVYWCNTNNESNILNNIDKEAVEITGSQSIEKKEDILRNFAKGDIKRIITKARITGLGLNWQHCNHSVFFPTWSYEQYYQAIRRFWRFGQKKEVTIDLVISDGQKRVLDTLDQKTKKAIELHDKLIENVNRQYKYNSKEYNKNIINPKFL